MKTPYALCSLKRQWQIVLLLFWIPKQLLMIISLSSVLRSTMKDKGQKSHQDNRHTAKKNEKINTKNMSKMLSFSDWLGITEKLHSFLHSAINSYTKFCCFSCGETIPDKGLSTLENSSGCKYAAILPDQL